MHSFSALLLLLSHMHTSALPAVLLQQLRQLLACIMSRTHPPTHTHLTHICCTWCIRCCLSKGVARVFTQ